MSLTNLRGAVMREAGANPGRGCWLPHRSPQSPIPALAPLPRPLSSPPFSTQVKRLLHLEGEAERNLGIRKKKVASPWGAFSKKGADGGTEGRSAHFPRLSSPPSCSPRHPHSGGAAAPARTLRRCKADSRLRRLSLAHFPATAAGVIGPSLGSFNAHNCCRTGFIQMAPERPGWRALYQEGVLFPVQGSPLRFAYTEALGMMFHGDLGTGNPYLMLHLQDWRTMRVCGCAACAAYSSPCKESWQSPPRGSSSLFPLFATPAMPFLSGTSKSRLLCTVSQRALSWGTLPSFLLPIGIPFP